MLLIELVEVDQEADRPEAKTGPAEAVEKVVRAANDTVQLFWPSIIVLPFLAQALLHLFGTPFQLAGLGMGGTVKTIDNPIRTKHIINPR